MPAFRKPASSSSPGSSNTFIPVVGEAWGKWCGPEESSDCASFSLLFKYESSPVYDKRNVYLLCILDMTGEWSEIKFRSQRTEIRCVVLNNCVIFVPENCDFVVDVYTHIPLILSQNLEIDVKCPRTHIENERAIYTDYEINIQVLLFDYVLRFGQARDWCIVFQFFGEKIPHFSYAKSCAFAGYCMCVSVLL